LARWYELGTSSSKPNLVLKNRIEIRRLRADLQQKIPCFDDFGGLQKFEVIASFSYFSTHFYVYNVEI